MRNNELLLFFSPDYFTVHIVYIFILGLVFGSFLNVCIYRIPMGKSIVSPASHCFTCNYFLKWYDNIPLISYILLMGKCRKCGAHISLRYFFVELLTACLFTLIFYKYRYSWASLVYIVFTGMLIISTFTDIDHWIIPDVITIPGTIIGIIIAITIPILGNNFIVSDAGPFIDVGNYTSLLNSIVGAAAGFFLFYAIALFGTLIFRKEAMGGGDIKLLAFVGSFVGWLNVLVVLILSSFIGTILSGSLVLSEKIIAKINKKRLDSSQENKEKKQGLADEKISVYHHIPFGPYLAFSSYIVLIWGNDILQWYQKNIYFPLHLL